MARCFTCRARPAACAATASSRKSARAGLRRRAGPPVIEGACSAALQPDAEVCRGLKVPASEAGRTPLRREEMGVGGAPQAAGTSSECCRRRPVQSSLPLDKSWRTRPTPSTAVHEALRCLQKFHGQLGMQGRGRCTSMRPSGALLLARHVWSSFLSEVLVPHENCTSHTQLVPAAAAAGSS